MELPSQLFPCKSLKCNWLWQIFALLFRIPVLFKSNLKILRNYLSLDREGGGQKNSLLFKLLMYCMNLLQMNKITVWWLYVLHGEVFNLAEKIKGYRYLLKLTSMLYENLLGLLFLNMDSIYISPILLSMQFESLMDALTYVSPYILRLKPEKLNLANSLCQKQFWPNLKVATALKSWESLRRPTRDSSHFTGLNQLSLSW